MPSPRSRADCRPSASAGSSSVGAESTSPTTEAARQRGHRGRPGGLGRGARGGRVARRALVGRLVAAGHQEHPPHPRLRIVTCYLLRGPRACRGPGEESRCSSARPPRPDRLSRENRFCGAIDPPLTTPACAWRRPSGRAYADRKTWDAIYCSPSLRARQTAARSPVARASQPVLETGLREIAYGEWEGLKHEDAKAKWPGMYAYWAPTPPAAPRRGRDGVHGRRARRPRDRADPRRRTPKVAC